MNRNKSFVLKKKSTVLKRGKESAGNKQKIRILKVLPRAVQNNHSCLLALASLFHGAHLENAKHTRFPYKTPHFHSSPKLQAGADGVRVPSDATAEGWDPWDLHSPAMWAAGKTTKIRRFSMRV